jgi:hypothetical protein
METTLTSSQSEFVKEAIQDELLKRGITARINRFEEKNERLELETEPFQTYPVMFKKIHVYNHLSGFTFSNPDKNVIELYIGLSFRYTLFSGGSNGSDLMDLRFRFIKGSTSIQMIK